SGSVQVDTGGSLSVTSDTFTAAGVNTQGGTVVAALHGLDLDEIGDVSGHGQLFGHVELGTDGVIAGSGAMIFELFGHVSGTGTISDTSIFGNVSPGNSAGQLGLTDVVLSSAGTLNLEIGGTATQQYDQVTLAGAMSLAGDLEVQLIDSFVPQVGDTFSLFNLEPSLNLQGGFSDILLPELASGVWDLADLYTTGELLVATSPVTPGPEDLNMDGTVDSLDLGILLETYGTVGTPSTGELNGTSPVDSLDLGILLAAFNTSSSGAATAAVPEPHTLLLASLASMGLTLRRRWAT
ncbi:MAG: PEP-CTERM sorting domain-containing protein, partial [Pirellulales bacterium]|nr:PEP-CTERM sorting domain-containing protein [Pirellulales bacterium]